MYRHKVHINEWDAEYIITPHHYDSDVILESLRNARAPRHAVRSAMEIMDGLGFLNTGFTYVNTRRRKAVVVIGPVSSMQELINTFIHETYHLAVSITESYGYDLSGEVPAYLIGDLARELADVICTFGCDLYEYATETQPIS